jgi:hypothetical protein
MMLDSQKTGSRDDFFVDGWDIAVDRRHTSIGIGELPRRFGKTGEDPPIVTFKATTR